MHFLIKTQVLALEKNKYSSAKLSLNQRQTLSTNMEIFKLNGHAFVLFHIKILGFLFISIFYEEMQ